MTEEFLRDAFIDELFNFAKNDKEIVFISADFGAPALDRFRTDLPDQFFHSGISEQHMIDMAAGLALSGKKVFVYAMAPFITLRCLEQIKCSLAMMDLPVTILSVGGGLSYADAGPTHYSNEDIACMRSTVGLEIITPLDSIFSKKVVNLCIKNQKLRLIRLERAPLKNIYDENVNLTKGFNYLKRSENNDTLIISYGFMAHKLINYENKSKYNLMDLYKIKPITNEFINEIKIFNKIITVEEHCRDGGFGSAIGEVILDNNLKINLKRFTLDEIYFFENGGREYLTEKYGLSIKEIFKESL